MTDEQQPQSQGPCRVDTGGGAYIGGSVDAGRDVIGRDQIIGQTQEGISLDEFLQLLAQLRQGIPTAELDADVAEIIEGDVTVIEDQAHKEQPHKSIILSKLKGVTELLTEAGKIAAAAAPLVPLAQKALTWAQQLF